MFFFLFYSCIKEIDITNFSDQYGDFEQELRVEALILPADSTAIIRIDKTIAIDNQTLFNCLDDGGNEWIGSACVCTIKNISDQCPKYENECISIDGNWIITPDIENLEGYCNLEQIDEYSWLHKLKPLIKILPYYKN